MKMNASMETNADQSSKSTLRLCWNSIEVSVEKGDITNVNTDIILTTCDPMISCSHGVAKAIVDAAGECLEVAIRSRMEKGVRLHFGEVLALNAEALDAWCVLFVCPCRGCFDDLKEAYHNALTEAMHLGAKRVAMSGFGTGLFGASAQVSAMAALSAVFDTELALGSMKSIRIVDIDERTVSAFREELIVRSRDMTGAELLYDDVFDCQQNSGWDGLNDENFVYESPLDRFTTTVHSDATLSHYADDGVECGSNENEEVCAVCLDNLCNNAPFGSVVQLNKCKHIYHRACLEEAFSRLQAQCPLCKRWYGAPRGNQPVGATMTVYRRTGKVPGFPRVNSYFLIEYNLPGGIQTREHPRPGVRFSGIRRYAYLPLNAEGEKVLQLFKLAFSSRLMFTVGDSVSTGQRNVAIFNGIHNKTSLSGGPIKFGYPDGTYLERVKQELAAVGVTEQLLDDALCTTNDAMHDTMHASSTDL